MNEFYGLAIGFVIVAGGYGAGHISGGCFNPAVALGIDVSSAQLGFGWCAVYIVHELVGACIAATAQVTSLVAAHVHRDDGFHDHALTFLFVAWGQFTDHDITLTSEIDEVEEEDLNCCNGPNVTHPMCFPIMIPENDHFYAQHNQRCMNFVRSNGGVRPGCRLGPRETENRITSVLDANVVYSNHPEDLEDLRSFERGEMKTLPVFRDHGLLDLLPLSLEDPDEGCIRP